MPNQRDLDNHANQMNPNNDAYWESRGYDGRPDYSYGRDVELQHLVSNWRSLQAH